jgi:hypothetical protein
LTGSSDPGAAVFVALAVPEAVQVSVKQDEALQEAAEWRHAVAAALASVRAEGWNPARRTWGAVRRGGGRAAVR